jgi:hypothetical protein
MAIPMVSLLLVVCFLAVLVCSMAGRFALASHPVMKDRMESKQAMPVGHSGGIVLVQLVQ